MRILVAGLLLCWVVRAGAHDIVQVQAQALLRPMGMLAGPVVHVSDLWDGAGAAGARVLGPGPDPGGRIVVGAAQLGAIAHAYGIDWQAQGAADQVVLERPGAPLRMEAVLGVLRPALKQAGAALEDTGASDGMEISLPFFAPPMLDAGAAPVLNVEALQLQAGGTQFGATLVIDGAAGPMRIRLTGNLVRSVQVAAPSRALQPGSVIGPGDLVLEKVRATVVSGDVVRDPSQALGLALRHSAYPGQPIALGDLVRPPSVLKGARVAMQLQAPGIDLGAVGEALEDGAVGDRVGVRNPASGTVVAALVTGIGTVRVMPGEVPVAPHGGFGTPPAQGGFTIAAR